MAFQQVPDTAEAVAQFSYEGRISVITFYALKSAGYDLGDLENLADAVDDVISTNVPPLLTPAQTYLGVNVRGLDQENDLATSISHSPAVAGTVQGAALPPNVTLAIKRLSGLTGRSARGRIFIPYLNQNFMQTDRNFVTQAAADDWVDLLNAVNNACTAISWTPVIVSRFAGGVQRAVALTFEIENWVVSDLNVDSQRRRLKPD